jgi:hypothetical protein
MLNIYSISAKVCALPDFIYFYDNFIPDIWYRQVILFRYTLTGLVSTVLGLSFSQQWLENCVLLDIMVCSTVKVIWHFREANLFHIHGQRVSQVRNGHAGCFMRLSCLAVSSILKVEAACFSEISNDFHQATQCYIPEDRTLYWAVFLNKPVEGNLSSSLSSCLLKKWRWEESFWFTP